MKETIGEKIAMHRKRLGLTQEELGGKLGVSGQAVSKWERGENLPDLMLLPEICKVFDASSDELLSIPAREKTADPMQDFCAYARENGRTDTVLEAVGRLFNDVGINRGVPYICLAPDDIRVWDERGFGFLLSGERLTVQPEHSFAEIADFLRPLTEETVLAIISRLSFDCPLTAKELTELIGAGEEKVNRALFALMERRIAVCDTVESSGIRKRGYLLDYGIAGIRMILAGCETANCGGESRSWLSFTRMRN